MRSGLSEYERRILTGEWQPARCRSWTRRAALRRRSPSTGLRCERLLQLDAGAMKPNVPPLRYWRARTREDPTSELRPGMLPGLLGGLLVFAVLVVVGDRCPRNEPYAAFERISASVGPAG